MTTSESGSTPQLLSAALATGLVLWALLVIGWPMLESIAYPAASGAAWRALCPTTPPGALLVACLLFAGAVAFAQTTCHVRTLGAAAATVLLSAAIALPGMLATDIGAGLTMFAIVRGAFVADAMLVTSLLLFALRR